MTVTFNHRYAAHLDEIERNFPVSEWRAGDLEIWPLARMDLYHDLYFADAGVSPPAERPLPLRIAGRVAMPLRNLWWSRRDLAHHVMRPVPAHAIFLGDGFSLDRIDGQWRDRFGEPLIAALEARGHRTFLMQTGYLGRLPWYRPTFPANLIESRGLLKSLATRLPLELPGHEAVLGSLARSGVNAPSLSRARLERHARLVAATAASFERVLEKVRPTLAFTVTYQSRLGPAFMLACRRQGVLSVALQRTPHESAPQAYRWVALPARGYATLPAVFWNWNQEDTARLNECARNLAFPWHAAIRGGHTQLAPYLDDQHPLTRTWDARFASVGDGANFEREILVALQPLHGYRAVWEALCAQIEASPPSWRWWIRRHPASTPGQDAESARLLALRAQNVMNADAANFPLPVLLRHMSAVLSLGSGAAVEGSMFGVPAFFLLDAARHTFADLIARGAAQIIDVGSVNEVLAKVRKAPLRAAQLRAPAIDETLLRLEERARVYRRACETASTADRPRVAGGLQ
jgi:hypothetical protein